MVSVNAKGLTKQRSPLSPLGSTNGALPRNDGTAKKSALHDMQKFLDTEEFSIEPTADKNPSTEASDEPIAADPFRTAISDSSIGSANEFVEMVKKPPTNAGLVVHAKGQSRMSVTCCNTTLGVWRMNGKLLIPAGQGCDYTTLKQDYSGTHTCSPNHLNAFYWEVYQLAMQEKPGYTFEMVELGPENSKKVQCCPCFDSEKANLDADDEHPVAHALTNVYVAQRPAFKKQSDPSANTLTVLAPHLRQKYSSEGSRFKSMFAAATSTDKIKDTTADPLTLLVQVAKDEASQAKLFGVASQAVVSLVAESVELAAQELTKVKRTVAGHDKSIAAIQELVFSMEKKRDEEVAKLAQAQRADNQGLLREVQVNLARMQVEFDAETATRLKRASRTLKIEAAELLKGLRQSFDEAQVTVREQLGALGERLSKETAQREKDTALMKEELAQLKAQGAGLETQQQDDRACAQKQAVKSNWFMHKLAAVETVAADAAAVAGGALTAANDAVARAAATDKVVADAAASGAATCERFTKEAMHANETAVQAAAQAKLAVAKASEALVQGEGTRRQLNGSTAINNSIFKACDLRFDQMERNATELQSALEVLTCQMAERTNLQNERVKRAKEANTKKRRNGSSIGVATACSSTAPAVDEQQEVVA